MDLLFRFIKTYPGHLEAFSRVVPFLCPEYAVLHFPNGFIPLILPPLAQFFYQEDPEFLYFSILVIMRLDLSLPAHEL
jgi:hypothetical protein